MTLTFEQKLEAVILDYWAGNITLVRCEEMIRNIKAQEAQSGQEEVSSDD